MVTTLFLHTFNLQENVLILSFNALSSGEVGIMLSKVLFEDFHRNVLSVYFIKLM